MKQPTSSKLRSAVLAFGALVMAVGVAAPAYAEQWDRNHDRHAGDRHWRGHRDWDRGGAYVGPSYGYYGYGYPPPPVYYPQPGFSINIPLDIR
jgi:hypothetical protein